MTEIQNSKDSQFGLFIKLAENEADLFVLFIAKQKLFFLTDDNLLRQRQKHSVYSYIPLYLQLCSAPSDFVCS